MMKNMEIRLTGFGGQGVITCSIILADIALNAGKIVAQSQAYGPEARGGICKAEVVISEKEIGFTKVTNPTFLLCLSQASVEKFIPMVDENCTVLIDSSLTLPSSVKAFDIYKADIINTANEKLGKSFTVNIVALGVINKILNIAPREVCEEVVKNYIPKHTEEINLKALRMGANLEVVQVK